MPQDVARESETLHKRSERREQPNLTRKFRKARGALRAGSIPHARTHQDFGYRSRALNPQAFGRDRRRKRRGQEQAHGSVSQCLKQPRGVEPWRERELWNWNCAMACGAAPRRLRLRLRGALLGIVHGWAVAWAWALSSVVYKSKGAGAEKASNNGIPNRYLPLESSLHCSSSSSSLPSLYPDFLPPGLLHPSSTLFPFLLCSDLPSAEVLYPAT